MYISRNILKKAKHQAHIWFINQESMKKQSNIHHCAYSHLRGRPFHINYNKAHILLQNVNFICDIHHNHWAETNGISISLNNIKSWDYDNLFWTLIHEAIHGIITCNNHEIPEEKEHSIMYDINPLMI